MKRILDSKAMKNKHIILSILFLSLSPSLISCDNNKTIVVVPPSISIKTSVPCSSLYHYGDSGTVPSLSQTKYYTSKDEVALYLKTYNDLPDNYIRKDQYNNGGKNTYGSSTRVGGDYFSNKYGNGEYMINVARSMTECDIAKSNTNRGVERLVYSSEFRIFYTNDHYETFQEYLGYKNWGPKFNKGQFVAVCK